MKYKIVYLIWFCLLGILAFSSKSFEWLPHSIFILNMLFCAIVQQILIRTILKTAKQLDPEHFDSIHSYFYVSRDMHKLFTTNHHLKDCIQKYLDLRSFNIADIIWVLFLIVFIAIAK